MIQRIVAILFYMMLVVAVSAQKECGTKAPAIKPVITEEKLNRIAGQRTMFSSPYPVKVFIRVFANDDGSNLAAAETDVLRQFENMRVFYQSHEICFILTGYEIIRNSDLNNMEVTETNDLNQISALALSSSMNIFVHATLEEDGGSQNGYAYDIPNHFLSIVRGAVNSTTNTSTMAHEMGHCLGLLHTFETAYGNEAAARTGDCRDCPDEGDLLCDTNADRDTDEDLINASNCNYIGSATDECNMQYLMETTNIMSYGRRECRDHFTLGQGVRARVFLLDDHAARIAENTLVIGNAALTVGLLNFAARNSISFSATNFTVSAGATANFSSKVVTFSPGVTLAPASGYVVARVGTYCQ